MFLHCEWSTITVDGRPRPVVTVLCIISFHFFQAWVKVAAIVADILHKASLSTAKGSQAGLSLGLKAHYMRDSEF